MTDEAMQCKAITGRGTRCRTSAVGSERSRGYADQALDFDNYCGIHIWGHRKHSVTIKTDGVVMEVTDLTFSQLKELVGCEEVVPAAESVNEASAIQELPSFLESSDGPAHGGPEPLNDRSSRSAQILPQVAAFWKAPVRRKITYKTAANEALVLCRKFYPWRAA